MLNEKSKTKLTATEARTNLTLSLNIEPNQQSAKFDVFSAEIKRLFKIQIRGSRGPTTNQVTYSLSICHALRKPFMWKREGKRYKLQREPFLFLSLWV